jgi:hypothetical protein
MRSQHSGPESTESSGSDSERTPACTHTKPCHLNTQRPDTRDCEHRIESSQQAVRIQVKARAYHLSSVRLTSEACRESSRCESRTTGACPEVKRDDTARWIRVRRDCTRDVRQSRAFAAPCTHARACAQVVRARVRTKQYDRCDTTEHGSVECLDRGVLEASIPLRRRRSANHRTRRHRSDDGNSDRSGGGGGR